MNSAKWSAAIFFVAANLTAPLWAAQQDKAVQGTPAADPAMTAAPRIVEEMLAKSSTDSAFMDAEQVKAVADQMRFAEYRIQDLLSDLRTEKWKMSDAARSSFGETIKALQTQMESLKAARTHLAERPDSMYAGFETYATVGTILPRLEGVAQTVGQADNASFGAQFSEAGNRLFDLQQKLGPYLGFLLRNQDSILLALENNLASCQNDLGHAMRGQTERPKWMKNSAPVRARRTKTKVPVKESKRKEDPPKP